MFQAVLEIYRLGGVVEIRRRRAVVGFLMSTQSVQSCKRSLANVAAERLVTSVWECQVVSIACRREQRESVLTGSLMPLWMWRLGHDTRAELERKIGTYNEMFVLLVELVAVFAMSSPALERAGVFSSHDFDGCVGDIEVCGVSHMLNCQAYEHEDCHEVLGMMLLVAERRESTDAEDCYGALEFNRPDDTPQLVHLPAPTSFYSSHLLLTHSLNTF